MQLAAPPRPRLVRQRLGAAACVLLASGAAVARADSGATTQLDATLLRYGEQSRVTVTEPTVRITRLLPDGQSLTGQVTLDVISGASPSGAMPVGVVPAGQPQTMTTPSGNVVSAGTPDPSAIPTSRFGDTRIALDGGWSKPFGLFTPSFDGHFSHEKDYRSLGGDGKMSIDLFRRLVTLTVGGGYNHDGVFPKGGTRAPLTDGSVIIGHASNPKNVATGMASLSRVVTRRWMVAASATRILERGYLTEPYKIVSLLDDSTGVPVGQVTENRPATRSRNDVLASSVYHLTQDVMYLTYRYYWDDWGVRSSTVDARYRRELGGDTWLEPHVRFYTQTGARFFRFGLLQGEPLPEYVTADQRLDAMKSVTVGGTLGFKLTGYPGEFTARAEYIAEFGNGHPDYVTGVQRGFNLFPTLNIGSLLLGYSVQF